MGNETVQEFQGTLVVMRCWCGIQHAVPEALRDLQLRQHHDGKNSLFIWCPLGHQHKPAAKTRVKQLEQDLDRKHRALANEQSRHDQTREELRHTEASRRAEKGAKTKIKKRIAHGVCPCCHRTFANVAAHMKTQHPEELE